MRQRIKDFLYEQLNEEKGLTAALIIQTLNKDQEKVSLDWIDEFTQLSDH
jgi:hypothetical protein